MDTALFLPFMNNAVINTGLQISVLVSIFNSVEYMPRSGITWSYGNSMFNLSWNHQNFFHTSTPI